MKVARLFAGRREVAAIPLYNSLYEVPLSRAIDFLKAREIFDNEEEMAAGNVNEGRVMVRAVGAFFGLELLDMIGVDAVDAGDVADSIESLYTWIVSLMGTFTGRMRTPEDCKFEYKGEAYHIPTLAIRTMTGLPAMPANLETGEMIEAYEIKRICTAGMKKGDPDGNFMVSYFLQLLAALARKEGEKLPVSDSECAAFIEARAVHFQEIDAGTALDVDFFLAMRMKPCAETRTAVGFLSNRLFDLVHAMQRRGKRNRMRSTMRSKEARKRLREAGGWRFILKSLNGDGSHSPAKAR